MGYLFTSESVSEGHPDKVGGSDFRRLCLTKLLAYDPSSKVACETFGDYRTRWYWQEK